MRVFDERSASQPLVSVVTPFYNTEKYLAECIESVLTQSYENWEYILVNNCSTDRSREIAEDYAKRDKRISVINCDIFLDQVANYNRSLTYISNTSKYAKVVQADDWIFPDCLRKMISVAEENPTVGIVGAYCLIGKKSQTPVYLDGLPCSRAVFSGSEVCRRFLLESLYVFGSPTSLLIRADLVRSRNPFYPDSSPFEDSDVCFELLQNCDFGFVPQVLTFTRRDNESIMSDFSQFNSFLLFEFLTLMRYGRFYLSHDEYRRRDRELRQRYLRFLGENVVRFRGTPFWQFHKSSLEKIGYPLHWTQLCSYALLEVVDNMLNPLNTLRIFLRYIRTKKVTSK